MITTFHLPLIPTSLGTGNFGGTLVQQAAFHLLETYIEHACIRSRISSLPAAL